MGSYVYFVVLIKSTDIYVHNTTRSTLQLLAILLHPLHPCGIILAICVTDKESINPIGFPAPFATMNTTLVYLYWYLQFMMTWLCCVLYYIWISADSLLTLWIEFICELFEKQYMFDYTKIWDERCIWIYVSTCVMAMEQGAVIAWSKYNVILHMSR